MIKIWRERDNRGGVLEVHILKHNNHVPEDLIWLHVKRGKSKKDEVGFVMTPAEAHSLIRGLFLSIDFLYEKYNLWEFRVSHGGIIDKMIKRELVWYRRVWRFFFPPKPFTTKDLKKACLKVNRLSIMK